MFSYTRCEDRPCLTELADGQDLRSFETWSLSPPTETCGGMRRRIAPKMTKLFLIPRLFLSRLVERHGFLLCRPGVKEIAFVVCRQTASARRGTSYSRITLYLACLLLSNYTSVSDRIDVFLAFADVRSSLSRSSSSADWGNIQVFPFPVWCVFLAKPSVTRVPTHKNGTSLGRK